MCEYFACMCVVYCMGAWYPERTGESVRSPGTGRHLQVLSTEPESPEKQQVLLTAEASVLLLLLLLLLF